MQKHMDTTITRLEQGLGAWQKVRGFKCLLNLFFPFRAGAYIVTSFCLWVRIICLHGFWSFLLMTAWLAFRETRDIVSQPTMFTTSLADSKRFGLLDSYLQREHCFNFYTSDESDALDCSLQIGANLDLVMSTSSWLRFDRGLLDRHELFLEQSWREQNKPFCAAVKFLRQFSKGCSSWNHVQCAWLMQLLKQHIDDWQEVFLIPRIAFTKKQWHQ